MTSVNSITSALLKKVKILKLKFDNVKETYSETGVIKQINRSGYLKKTDKDKLSDLKILIISEKNKMIKVKSLMKDLYTKLSVLQSEFSVLNNEFLLMKKAQERKGSSKIKTLCWDQLHLNVRNLRRVLKLMDFSKLKNVKEYDDVKKTFFYNLKSPNVVDFNESALSDELKKIKVERETVRNKRQVIATMFENTNKIAGQLIKRLTSIMRTINEMKKGIIRNIR